MRNYAVRQAPVQVALILAVCLRRSNSGGLENSWQVYSPGAPISSKGPCIAWVVSQAPESQQRPLQPRQTILQQAEQRYWMALLCQLAALSKAGSSIITTTITATISISPIKETKHETDYVFAPKILAKRFRENTI